MNNTNNLTIASSIIAVGLIAGAIIFASNGNGGSTTKKFDIVMQNNRYNPSEIEVNLGDRVVINFTNKDNVAHGVGIREFNATVPNGHIFPGQSARMEFVADKRINTDAAVCGGPNPTDKTDDHGEELVVKVI